uniref:NBS-LRR-like resistance protein n=1 Tax=Oryza sativa TaxID=4530 RepID=A0A0U2RPN1_ORYSA|nr:NBS-LRR-like resistance protein [Oryza sativa]
MASSPAAAAAAAATATGFYGKAVATPVISYILNKAFTYLVNYWRTEDMESVKAELLKMLPHVQAVFDAVDWDNIKELSAALDAWLWQLRDAVEEAEDSLDELAYHRLKEEVKARDEQETSGSVSKLKGKLIRKLTKHVPKNGMLKRLKESVEGLHKAIVGVKDFMGFVNKVGVVNHFMDYELKMKGKQFETSSRSTAIEVFGLEKEKDIMIKWLTEPTGNDPADTNLRIFTIVGHGGFGKTTLAQLIYNEKKVQICFDICIWVSVSSHFDAPSITKSIIEAVSKKTPPANTLEALHAILEDRLISKRFLLILDNVWNDNDMNEWEKLLAPLRIGGTGSIILLTTRMKSVGDMAGYALGLKVQHLKLDGLLEKDILMLFNKHAFRGLSLDCCKNLHPLGEQIVKKISGCPLAAKVIGAHLRDNISYMYWNKILQEDLQNLQLGMDGVMKVLRLSYHHLPANLQLCFRYCSIFPQGYRFGKKELVEMWLGSGMILQTTDETKTLEDIGGQCLDQLTRKSFFEFTSKERDGVVLEEHYAMHDVLHDLAQVVSSGECLRIGGIRSMKIAKTVRHLSVKIVDSAHLKELFHLNNLRSLVIEFVGDDPSMNYSITFDKILKSFRSLRLLCVTAKCWFDMPGAVSKLIHLRYISLLSTKRSFLVSMHKLFTLYHLETLKIMEYSEGKMLKLNGLSNLVCLRNLHVPYDTISSIPRIGKLTCLEYLNAFSVQKRIGHTVCELKNLSQLHHLRLRDIQNVGSCKEVLDANLKDKKHMRTFSLHWSSHEVIAENVSDLVLDYLQPHSDLEELDIIGFSGTRLPFWITDSYLVNIVSLNIINCCKIEHVPSLASLCSLKNLFLQDLSLLASMGCMLHECDKIPVGCSHSFQECPSSIDMSEGMVDVESEGVSFPPHLSTLTIRGCPQLMKLPTLPSMLKQLKIEKSGLMLLPKMYQKHNDTEGSFPCPNESQLTNVLIEYCPNLNSLLHCFLGQNVTLTSLRELRINQCEKLEYLPLNGLMELVNLQILEVSDCSMLKKSGMEVKLLPSSLEQLSIKSCGELANILIDLLAGLEALTFLELANCSHLISLPTVKTFEALTALKELRLYGCPELSSLGGLQCLKSLRLLIIRGCCSLTKISSLPPPLQCWSSQDDSTENSLKLGTLFIDDHSLLFVEPLRSVRFTRRLSLLDDPIMTSLPEQWLLQNRTTLSILWLWNVKSLQCLPSSMKDLCHLQSFTLFNAPLVNSLPDMPASLKDLIIDCCQIALAERCRKGGCDWSKIAHVTLLKINGNEPL